MLKGRKILIGITGGIAAYKICSLVRFFIKEGSEVKVIMTPSASKFVSPLTLSVLSCNEVVINMFPENDNYGNTESVSSKTWHINYGLWADIFVIAPATANTIAKIVCGISDNFLLSTVLASRCPVVLAPSMDEDMYNNKITQDNLRKISESGIKIIQPVIGELASGLYGMGKMAEPETIFNFIKKELVKKKDLTGKNILISAGPTREKIDPVRYISNYSSGKMGFEIAKAASERGASVTLVTGPVNLEAHPSIKRINVRTAAEMFDSVKKVSVKQDLIIMAAAVTDFKPSVSSDKKIKKEKNITGFSLKLEQTKDILKFLGEKKSKYFLIGFALETDNGVKNAKEKLVSKNADMIVLNNPGKEGTVFGSETNLVTFIDRKHVREFPEMTKYDIANAILDYYLIRKSSK